MIGNSATPLKESRIHTLLRIVLGIIFLWASWEKIVHPSRFADIIDAYRILPSPTVNFVAIVLPWVEALCGLCLVSGCLTRGGVLLVDMMMLIFIIAFVVNMYRGIETTCGCFSLSTATGDRTYFNLARNVVILLMGLAALIYEIKKDQFTPRGFPRI